MRYQNSPRAGETAFAGGYSNHVHCRNGSAIKQEQFPRCELYGVLIVNELRKDCALAEPNPGWAAFAWEQRGDARLAAKDTLHGVADRRRGLICEACTRRLMPHPIVHKLRVELGVAEGRRANVT